MQLITDFINNLPQRNNLGEKITLVGATKTVSCDKIAQAVNCGLNHIGENKAQEFTEKYPNFPKATYHFIGHLQTNKAKYIVGKAHLIHSVDSVKLAKEISKIAKKQNITQEVLLEVNVAKDESKHGFFEEDIASAILEIKQLENISVVGLMTVLPNTKNKNKLASLCLQMRNLYDIINKQEKCFKYLSMGMSGDYQIAINNGSNMIRIGSLLFGKRYYSK